MRYLITQTLINESEITKRALYLPKTKMVIYIYIYCFILKNVIYKYIY